MIPQDSNPEETGPRAGSGSSPTRPEPLGPVEIPSELEIAIRAYEPGDPGVTLSGFSELRHHIIDGGDRPDEDDLNTWLDRQAELVREALPLIQQASDVIRKSLTGNGSVIPEWVDSDWFATLKNPWAEDFGSALEEAKVVLD